MIELLVILFLLGLAVFAWIVTHLRPLAEHEISRLAAHRRNKKIGEYYTFEKHQVSASRDFKKSMSGDGRFYEISDSLSGFPSIAAALLKFNKHEWIIIAFERHTVVNLIWINKGFDRSTVAPYLSIENIIALAKKNGSTSVLVFHNHPNSNPACYDCRSPSNQDISSATNTAQVLNESGINLLEFVCERGNHHEYYRSPALGFYPITSFVNEIVSINGKSWRRNLALHWENR